MATEILSRTEAKAKGLKRYFTGEPCSRGHIAERRTINGSCHQCILDDKLSARAAKPGYRSRAKIEKSTHGKTRVCAKCEKRFPNTSEHFVPLTKRQPGGTIWTGLSRECRTCRNERFRPFYKKNRNRLIKKATAHKRKRRIESEDVRNSDRISSRDSKRRLLADPKERAKETARNRDWCKANPDRVKKFKHTQPAMRRMRAAARNASELQATPPWISVDHLRQIECIYAIADFLTRKTGIKHDVDHYYPLQNPTSRGLHVPWNLRVITSAKNQAKGNRLPP